MVTWFPETMCGVKDGQAGGTGSGVRVTQGSPPLIVLLGKWTPLKQNASM